MAAEEIPLVSTLLDDALETFHENFRDEPQIAVCAPGRVNLIGEHTDYNHGFVLPMTLPLVTVILGAKVMGTKAELITKASSLEEPQKVEFDVQNLQKSHCACKQACKPKWANYVKGVVANFKEDVTIPAFKAVINSSVPIGSGLSSSAALEVAMYTFLEALTEKNTEAKRKALACQRAEHEFAGVPCGIMDQFVCVMGIENNALLIDCRSMGIEMVELNDPEIAFLIINSNVRHELTGSEYPTRKKQCLQAASLLGKKSLRDINMQHIEKLKKMDIDEEIIKRARHVVGEIGRTQAAAKFLKEKDYDQFGQLMYQSHKSLKNDYEVSCPEIDQLVELAQQVEGVLGSRMTGGGFGGCTITMVYQHAVEDAIKHISNYYDGTATFYVVKPSGGAQILEPPA